MSKRKQHECISVGRSSLLYFSECKLYHLPDVIQTLILEYVLPLQHSQNYITACQEVIQRLREMNYVSDKHYPARKRKSIIAPSDNISHMIENFWKGWTFTLPVFSIGLHVSLYSDRSSTVSWHSDDNMCEQCIDYVLEQFSQHIPLCEAAIKWNGCLCELSPIPFNLDEAYGERNNLFGMIVAAEMKLPR